MTRGLLAPALCGLGQSVAKREDGAGGVTPGGYAGAQCTAHTEARKPPPAPHPPAASDGERSSAGRGQRVV